MIEPEVAFMDLRSNMDLAEDFLKSVIEYILKKNIEDLEFLDNRLLMRKNLSLRAERSSMG